MPTEEPNPDMTEEDWLACMLLPEFIALIPAGRITNIVGMVIYIDGEGDSYTREEYMAKHNIDPEVAYQAKIKYINEHGSGVHT